MPHGDVLVRFGNSTLGIRDGNLDRVRAEVVERVGDAGMVDAAAIIANFSINNRVADATGIPLDAPMEMATRSLRAEIGTNQYARAADTPKGGWLSAIGARLLRRLFPYLLRRSGRGSGR